MESTSDLWRFAMAIPGTLVVAFFLIWSYLYISGGDDDGTA